MALVNKPDESMFASSAKRGEVDKLPDIIRDGQLALSSISQVT